MRSHTGVAGQNVRDPGPGRHQHRHDLHQRDQDLRRGPGVPGGGGRPRPARRFSGLISSGTRCEQEGPGKGFRLDSVPRPSRAPCRARGISRRVGHRPESLRPRALPRAFPRDRCANGRRHAVGRVAEWCAVRGARGAMEVGGLPVRGRPVAGRGRVAGRGPAVQPVVILRIGGRLRLRGRPAPRRRRVQPVPGSALVLLAPESARPTPGSHPVDTNVKGRARRAGEGSPPAVLGT